MSVTLKVSHPGLEPRYFVLETIPSNVARNLLSAEDIQKL